MKTHKTTGRESNMTLVRLIIDAETHISATLEKFDPMTTMQRQKGVGVESCPSRIRQHTKPR